MQGVVFSIEEFSVYDGPGIRTTVFLKGCPLRCTWCHNPEGQNAYPEIIKSPNGCIGCHQCEDGSEIKDGQLVYREKSIQNCPMGLLRFSGEIITLHELCERILRNKQLLQSGGVTFSGGEPLMQSEFLFSCLHELKGKVHTAIQTSGYCDPGTFTKAVELADYFLFDIKLISETLHRQYTGVSNANILKNLAYLASHSNDFVVRIPLIPDVTDTDENIRAIVNVLKQNRIQYVELLPYNKMAGGKYKMLGREYCPCFDEHKVVKIPEKIFKENGIEFQVL